jgi:hypothetical protein
MLVINYSFRDVEIPLRQPQFEKRLYWVSESVFQRDVGKYANQTGARYPLLTVRT